MMVMTMIFTRLTAESSVVFYAQCCHTPIDKPQFGEIWPRTIRVIRGANLEKPQRVSHPETAAHLGRELLDK